MIVCPKCAKENQDHYKFCLGCGAELPRDQARKISHHPATGSIEDEKTDVGQGKAAPPVAPAPPAESPAAPSAPPAAAAPAPAADAAPADPDIISCPDCGHENPQTNRFCAACGFKLAGVKPAAGPEAVPGLGAAAGPVASAPAEPAAPAVSEAAAPAAPAAEPAATPEPFVLTALLADGSEAGSVRIPAGETTVGRSMGGIFGGDGFLSPRHATFRCGDDGITIRDEGSLNGTFRKVEPEVVEILEVGDVFRIGQALLRVDSIEGKPSTADGVEHMGGPQDGSVARLSLVIGRDATGNSFCVPPEGLHLGRERGNVLFADDGYVSGLHCKVGPDDAGNLVLIDLNSSNGTFLRLKSEVSIPSGQIVLMGQQLYRITRDE